MNKPSIVIEPLLFGQFLLRSIVVPVLVSALTAFVTVKLTALWG